ncbi:hypothetical protein ACFX12_000294 [Malus domestica]
MNLRNMFKCNTIEGFGQIAGDNVIGCQGATHALKRTIKLVNHKFGVAEDESTGHPQVMKDSKADDKGFVLGLVICAFEIQLERKIPTIVVWRLNDNSNASRG